MASKIDIQNVILEGKEIITTFNFSEEGIDAIYDASLIFLQAIKDEKGDEIVESDVYKIVYRESEIIAEIGQEAYDLLRAEAEASLP